MPLLSSQPDSLTCPACGYDLSAHIAQAGDDSFHCSECGVETSRIKLLVHQQVQRRCEARTGPIWILLSVTPAIAFGLFFGNLDRIYDSGMGVKLLLPILLVGPLLMLGLSIHAASDFPSNADRIVMIIVFTIVLIGANIGLAIAFTWLLLVFG